ncbi:MAG TPA: type II toxin-antitoxin system RelE/ParE family toxin [Ginsengibacter sp.]|nr:type II toxin-antitoxin system RelE/ParE family toxin [Ginsengibacter sp.]
MNYKLIPTPPFERELKQLAKKYASLPNDLLLLEGQLLKNPTLGTPIGKNCFKIRLSIQSKGKGKSGEARIITYVQIVNEKIFMIAIYDKSSFENISNKELQTRLKNL